MASTDISIVSRTILLFRKKLKVKIVSLRRRKDKKPDVSKFSAKPSEMATVDIIGPFNTTGAPPQLDHPRLSPPPPSQAFKKPALRVCETELRSAADFVEPTTALEISSAITSTRRKGLTPLFNAYQIAKLLPSSDIPRAVVIDVRNMRAVSVDPVAKTLTCSAGATVKDCDVATARHGLAVVAGTWSNLRMGGVALGGGYGWLSGEHGLVTDNLLSVTAVLADGSVVIASETENWDLFWGIRGSYTNLGICADFTFRCHELSHDVVFGSLVFQGLDMLDKIVEAAMRIRTGREDVVMIEDESWGEKIDDGKTAFSVRVEFERPESGQFSAHVLVLLFHNGPLQAAEEIFAPMLNVASSTPSSSSSTLSPAYIGSLTVMPYKEVNAQLDYTLDHTGDLTFVSAGFSVPVTYPSTVSTLTDLASSLNSTLSSQSHASKAKDYSVVLGIDFRHGRLACDPEYSEKTVFAARFDGCMCYLRARWDGNSATTDEKSNWEIRDFVKSVGRDMRGRVRAWEDDEGTGKRRLGVAAYPGFCNQNDLEVKEMFGEENYERLKGLKEKYDPDNIFNGGFWKGTGGRGN